MSPKVLVNIVLMLSLFIFTREVSSESNSTIQCVMQNGILEPLYNHKISYIEKIQLLRKKIRKLKKFTGFDMSIFKLKKSLNSLSRKRKLLLPFCIPTYTDTPPPEKSISPEPTPTPTLTTSSTATPSPTQTATQTPIYYKMDVTPVFKQYGNSSSCNPNTPFIKATSFEVSLVKATFSTLAVSPRLIVSDADRFSYLSSRRSSDPVLDDYINRFLLHVVHNLSKQAIPTYTTDNALLDDGRILETLVYHYSLAYKLTGDTNYLTRAKDSVLSAVQNFPSWGITDSSLHIAASFAMAVAVGEDWLGNSFTPAQKTLIKNALNTKFLTPVLNQYRTGCKDAWNCSPGETHYWWTWSGMNISLVSHAASAIVALSLADYKPNEASEVLANALKGLRNGMKYFSPDGAGCEGPDYHIYAFKYAIFALSSLDRALGQSFGLWEEDGFSRAGDYILNFGGGKKRAFNFGNSTDTGKVSGEIQALCYHFQDAPTCAEVHNSLEEIASGDNWTRVDPEAILFYSEPEGIPYIAASSRIFHSSNEVSFEPPKENGERELRVAITAGVNKWNHSDQGDLGSIIAYVNDATLVKDYGYKPNNYYAGNTLGHSTLAFDETLQAESEKMGIVTYSPHPFEPFAIMRHFGGSNKINKWSRGIQVGATWFRLRDEFITKEPGILVRWSIQNDSPIQFLNGGKEVKFSLGRVAYRAEVVEPSNGTFTLGSMDLTDEESLDPSNKRLSIDLIGNGDDQCIEVLFYNDSYPRPNRSGVPLQEWNN